MLLWQYRIVLVLLLIMLVDNRRGEPTRRWRLVHHVAWAACLVILLSTFLGVPG